MGVVGGAEAAGLTPGAVRSGGDAADHDGSGLAGRAGGLDQDCGAEGSGRGAGAGAGSARAAGAGSGRTAGAGSARAAGAGTGRT
jgi:hypothetical protein